MQKFNLYLPLFPFFINLTMKYAICKKGVSANRGPSLLGRLFVLGWFELTAFKLEIHDNGRLITAGQTPVQSGTGAQWIAWYKHLVSLAYQSLFVCMCIRTWSQIVLITSGFTKIDFKPKQQPFWIIVRKRKRDSAISKVSRVTERSQKSKPSNNVSQTIIMTTAIVIVILFRE